MAAKALLTRAKTQKELVGVVYTEKDGLPKGRLPVRKTIIECMMYLLRPENAGKNNRSVTDAATILSYNLMEHWNFCNIHTMTRRSICNNIKTLYDEFIKNVQTRTKRRTEAWKAKMAEFNTKNNTLFDISTKDQGRIDELEKDGVKMGKMEMDFLEDQRGKRIGYCSAFVDRRWMKTMNRKKAEALALEKARKKVQDEEAAQKEIEEQNKEAMDVEGIDLDDSEVKEPDQAEDQDYTVPDEQPPVKKRRGFTSTQRVENDEMPKKWHHLRESEREVRSEFYLAVDKLISVYHCSKKQAVAAVIVVANLLFGRNWKFHDDEQDSFDADTAPCMKSIRDSGKAIEVVALKCLVELIMNSDDTVVTYHDDGSRKKGVGSFSVQGVTIDGKYRALPVLPIATETCENLASLKKAVLSILELCSGTPAREIFEKISFRMMDSTNHNFGVDEMVAVDLETDHIPRELLCNTHPALMFTREIVNVFTNVESKLGKDKLYATTLTSAKSSSHDTVLEQYLDVLMRLICKDFSHKPWNYSEKFTEMIDPKKNYAVQFTKQRFNRFVYAASLLVHHHEDVQAFLDKFENVTNSLACLVREFITVEALLAMALAAALIGVHLVEPYLKLTYHESITYERMIPAAQQLYSDLTTTDPERLLNLNEPAFKFISKRRFEASLWNKELVASLEVAIPVYKSEVLSLLKLLLPKLAEGWCRQRGETFGFGERPTNSGKSVLTIDKNKLGKAPISNMSGERHVGSVNYEIETKGPNLMAASSAIVKAKSADLVELRGPEAFKKERKTAKKYNEAVKKWMEEQKELAKQHLTSKELENIKIDKRRNQDLLQLKALNGPFTDTAEIDNYMTSTTVEAEKSKRLYLEVRYARDTCSSLPRSSDVFRLKRKYKNLESHEYAENLKVYMDRIKSNATATMDDFRGALDNLLLQ